MKKLLLVIFSVLAFAIPAWATIDLNTATIAQLETVKGIGPKKAQNIIDYRKKTPFKSVDDLGKVRLFGPKTMDKVRKEFRVGAAPKAAPVKAAPVKKALAKPAAKPVKTKPATVTAKPATAAKPAASSTAK